MMQRHKVVVFDLDDTLYKEIDYVKSGFRHIALLVSNVNAPEEDVYQLMINTYRQGGNAFESVVQKYGFQLFNVQWMIGVYRNHKPRISLADDAKAALDVLKANGTVMGIITDGRRMQQMNKIEALGLERYMDEENIIINEMEDRHKPDRRSFKIFMEKYGKDCDYWFVGDNTGKDFLAPNTLGWTTICLLDDGRNIHQQSFDHDKIALPKVKVNTLSEILNLI
jgi:putative hydrolase of the HAD superfamily